MRGEIIVSIRQITNVELTTDVLLFGTEAVTLVINSSIFKAVQKYIKLSKRFSPSLNKMMLLLSDNYFCILRPMPKKYFAVLILSGRCLNSMIKLQLFFNLLVSHAFFLSFLIISYSFLLSTFIN